MGFTAIGQRVLDDSAQFMIRASVLAIPMRRIKAGEYEAIDGGPELPVGHVERDGRTHAVVTLPADEPRPPDLAAFGFTLGKVSRITGPGHIVMWIADVDESAQPGNTIELTMTLT